MSDQAPATRQITHASNPKELTDYLTKSRGAIAAALPAHLTPERMLRLAVTQFSTNAKLRECTAISILSSVIVAAQIGLEIGVRGQGYLIPYGGVCTFVPGWQGLVGLLNNTGRATAWTGAVFEGDTFEYELGAYPKCRHIPGDNHDGDISKLTHVYACGRVNGSENPVIEVWTMAKIWAHRDKFNKVGQRHYSFQHPEMYARKIPLLQVLKYMPASVHLSNALTASNAAEAGRRADVVDGTVIDIEGSQEIREGNVGIQPQGDGKTMLEKRVAERPKPAEEALGRSPEAPAEQKTSSGPTATELLAEIIKKGAALDAGRAKIEKKCVEARLIEPAEKLDKLPVDRLANILDAWEGEGGIADLLSTPA